MQQLYWDSEQADVLHLDMAGVDTWEKYHQRVDTMFAAVDAAPQPCYVILHGRDVKPSGGPLPHFRATIQRAYRMPKLLLFISVDDHYPALFARMVQVVVDIYFWNQPNKVPYVRTESEARSIIARHRLARRKANT